MLHLKLFALKYSVALPPPPKKKSLKCSDNAQRTKKKPVLNVFKAISKNV